MFNLQQIADLYPWAKTKIELTVIKEEYM